MAVLGLLARLALLAAAAGAAAGAAPGGTAREAARGLVEDQPCCRICPDLFYAIKPPGWMREAVEAERDADEAALIEATGTVRAPTFLREAARYTRMHGAGAAGARARAWLRRERVSHARAAGTAGAAGAAAAAGAGGAPPAGASVFMQEVMRLNAHKQLEKLCCNVCKEEYTRTLRYPDLLSYEGGPEGPPPSESSDSALWELTRGGRAGDAQLREREAAAAAAAAAGAPGAGAAARFAEARDRDGIINLVSKFVPDKFKPHLEKFGAAVKPFTAGLASLGSALGIRSVDTKLLRSLGVVGNTFNPAKVMEQKRKRAAEINAAASAENLKAIMDSPQMKLNKELPPCCNMCPVGCPPVYVDDNAPPVVIPADELKPQDAPSKAYQMAESEKQRRARAEAIEKGDPTVDARDCCARTEEIASYVVIPGDTLPAIAERHCLTFADLQAANEQVVDPGQLNVDRLRLPKPNCTPAAANGAAKKPAKDKKKPAAGTPSFREARGDASPPVADAAGVAPADEPLYDGALGEGADGSMTMPMLVETDAGAGAGADADAEWFDKAKDLFNRAKAKVNEFKAKAKEKLAPIADAVHKHTGIDLRAKAKELETKVKAKVGAEVAGAVQGTAAGALLNQFTNPPKVLPIKIPTPGEKFYADKSAQTTEFDPPGAGDRPAACNPKVLSNCCHVCYTHWPDQHPRAEAKRRREIKLRAQRAAAAERRRNGHGGDLPFLQNPYLLQGGKQEGQIADETAARDAAAAQLRQGAAANADAANAAATTTDATANPGTTDTDQ